MLNIYLSHTSILSLINCVLSFIDWHQIKLDADARDRCICKPCWAAATTLCPCACHCVHIWVQCLYQASHWAVCFGLLAENGERFDLDDPSRCFFCFSKKKKKVGASSSRVFINSWPCKIFKHVIWWLGQGDPLYIFHAFHPCHWSLARDYWQGSTTRNSSTRFASRCQSTFGVNSMVMMLEFVPALNRLNFKLLDAC